MVGRNGTGKSTLLKILAGELRLSEGEVSKSGNLVIGFLNQDLQSQEFEDSAFGVALSAFSKALQYQKEIDDLLWKLETDYSDDILKRLDHCQTEFMAAGGYEMEQLTHQMLAGLGFTEEERQRPFTSFSGGWRMRILLAKMLLQKPDLLLLDEPTNHLDLPSLDWLEKYLVTFPGTYIIVSHDRYFLDSSTRRTIEIRGAKFYDYAGNFTFFQEKKAEQIELQLASYENQQKYIQETQRFIDRFRAKATKASQAQSRLKMLEKLERIDAPEDDAAVMDLKFRVKKRSGIDVISLQNINKAYGEKVLLKNTSGVIRRGDKIGLVGANGIGKTTLLRIIGDQEAFDGQRIVGHNVEEAIFAQHQLESLNLKNTILHEMIDAAPLKKESEIRAALGCFLFSGDDVMKKIGVLSGGEKSRVALCKVLLSEANFLLLDEPTNHLDMQSIEILTEALNNYEGTFVVISHDRHFLEEVTNKTWYIQDKEIKEYPGGFLEFSQSSSWQTFLPQMQAPTMKLESKKEKAPVVQEYKENKTNRNELKRIEDKIAKLEEEKKKIQEEMLTFAMDFEKIQKLQADLDKKDTELLEWMEKWEQMME